MFIDLETHYFEGAISLLILLEYKKMSLLTCIGKNFLNNEAI